MRARYQTFERRLTLDVGGREVRLLNLGPAHTEADTVVHVPDAGVLFAGDLLFIGCTPIVWSGPLAKQTDAAYAKGLDFQEAAFGIELAEYADWLDAERIVVNVYRRYREIHPDPPVLDRFALFGLMAEWDSRRERRA
ncbi:MBL fold metallo-hydrolase [Streptomyces sp. BP-8]|uniref:MBL fold metallo-hydrolase n=1 Tax=Streptomyces sirii TaxID=3127701 RepID=A0ABZ2QNQ1_9ACTN